MYYIGHAHFDYQVDISICLLVTAFDFFICICGVSDVLLLHLFVTWH